MSDLYTLWPMDCRLAMRLLMAPDSVDSCVTDPPYDLLSIHERFKDTVRTESTTSKSGPHQRTARGFMGKQWDGTGVAFDPATWAEAYRVLKPGGHLLAFGGTRTYHRMVCAIEDAGFEIRDTICWHYGSGFPKSHDVSKGIDRAAGAEREVVGPGQWAGREGTPSSTEDWRLRNEKPRSETSPATDEARQWSGWGTALKPATELIVVARKPLVGTVAQNVLTYGTGALNIDGCRVDSGGETITATRNTALGRMNDDAWVAQPGVYEQQPGGRWPANLIHDGSDLGWPDAAGQLATASTSDTPRNGQHIYGAMTRGSGGSEPRLEIDKSAARFFYCPKASKADRGEGNTHPTVKPHDLMRYLCRLVTPPGGLVLDPFTGSGSTGKAAIAEGFRFVGCEMTDEYVPIATARIDAAVKARHESRPCTETHANGPA